VVQIETNSLQESWLQAVCVVIVMEFRILCGRTFMRQMKKYENSGKALRIR
jgi:hypothetical protein